MKPEQVSRRGLRAEELLRDPLIVEALDGMEQVVFDNFKTSKWQQAEEREELHKQMAAVLNFRRQFEGWISEGKAVRLKAEQQVEPIV